MAKSGIMCIFLLSETFVHFFFHQGIFILEQKKKRLLEKEKSEKERIRKFEEQKKQELEKKRRYNLIVFDA